MWSQIIFFAAVALLIILLLRRAKMAKESLQAIGYSSRQFSATLLRFFASVGGLVQSLMGRVGKRRSPATSRFSVPSHTPIAGGHKFWQEEAKVDKLEGGSNLEEGEILYRAGKYDEAEQYFLKAAASHPGEAKIYARLGLLYLQQKNYSDAIEALKVAIKLDKHNPSRHYNLALAYSGNKDVQRAIASVREAITLDPVTPKYRQLLEQLLNS